VVEFRKNELGAKFYTYFENDWKEDEAYQIRDFADKFQIEVRLSRYYLMKMVDSGLLAQLKYKGSTWYVKREHRDKFKQFKFIGVRTL